MKYVDSFFYIDNIIMIFLFLFKIIINSNDNEIWSYVDIFIDNNNELCWFFY